MSNGWIGPNTPIVESSSGSTAGDLTPCLEQLARFEKTGQL